MFVSYLYDRVSSFLKLSKSQDFSNQLGFTTQSNSGRKEEHKKEIIKMKKNSVLVNVARGPVINEKDLYFALSKKLIRGAIIDTWYKYPKKENLKYFKPSKYNFSRLKNIIMTPHLSALTENLLERRVKIIIHSFPQ